jgi:hypothetical protein
MPPTSDWAMPTLKPTRPAIIPLQVRQCPKGFCGASLAGCFGEVHRYREFWVLCGAVMTTDASAMKVVKDKMAANHHGPSASPVSSVLA